MTGKSRSVLWEKLVRAPHGLIRDRTRTFAVRISRPTAWDTRIQRQTLAASVRWLLGKVSFLYTARGADDDRCAVSGLRGTEWTRMLECGVGASCRPRGIVVLLHHLIVTPLLVHSAALPFVTYPCALTRFN